MFHITQLERGYNFQQIFVFGDVKQIPKNGHSPTPVVVRRLERNLGMWTVKCCCQGLPAEEKSEIPTSCGHFVQRKWWWSTRFWGFPLRPATNFKGLGEWFRRHQAELNSKMMFRTAKKGMGPDQVPRQNMVIYGICVQTQNDLRDFQQVPVPVNLSSGPMRRLGAPDILQMVGGQLTDRCWDAKPPRVYFPQNGI